MRTFISSSLWLVSVKLYLFVCWNPRVPPSGGVQPPTMRLNQTAGFLQGPWKNKAPDLCKATLRPSSRIRSMTWATTCRPRNTWRRHHLRPHREAPSPSQCSTRVTLRSTPVRDRTTFHVYRDRFYMGKQRLSPTNTPWRCSGGRETLCDTLVPPWWNSRTRNSTP